LRLLVSQWVAIVAFHFFIVIKLSLVDLGFGFTVLGSPINWDFRFAATGFRVKKLIKDERPTSNVQRRMKNKHLTLISFSFQPF